jgi:hypothetical protein
MLIGAKDYEWIRSSQRLGNQVINFVVASLVMCDSVLGVRYVLCSLDHLSIQRGRLCITLAFTAFPRTT